MVLLTGEKNIALLMYKIAVTGPESSGKTTLAIALAQHFKSEWVPEFAREFLGRTNGKYVQKDLLEILKGQLANEEKYAHSDSPYLICDSDPLVLWVWSKLKFSRVDIEIDLAWKNHHYDLYLLLSPDIEWKEDPLRENKEGREVLFQIYLEQLKLENKPFAIIKGEQEERFSRALKAIEEISI